MPGSNSPATPRVILVAVDDSKQAQWALDEAVALAPGLEGRISLVHVLGLPPAMAPEFTYQEAVQRPALLRAANDLLKECASRVPAELLKKQILREGDAADQIIATAKEVGADLIVIGTHARGALGRFLLGSVAELVVRHAPCPVLTVGHPRHKCECGAEACHSEAGASCASK